MANYNENNIRFLFFTYDYSQVSNIWLSVKININNNMINKIWGKNYNNNSTEVDSIFIC